MYSLPFNQGERFQCKVLNWKCCCSVPGSERSKTAVEGGNTERFWVSPFYKHPCVFCKAEAAVVGHVHVLDEIFAICVNFGVAGLFAFASEPGNGFEKGTASCGVGFFFVFKKTPLLLQTILGPFQNGQVFGS